MTLYSAKGGVETYCFHYTPNSILFSVRTSLSFSLCDHSLSGEPMSAHLVCWPNACLEWHRTAAVPSGRGDIIAERLTGEEEAYNNSMHSLRLSV